MPEKFTLRTATIRGMVFLPYHEVIRWLELEAEQELKDGHKEAAEALLGLVKKLRGP